MSSKKIWLSSERGTSLIELAICLPVLLLLITGTVELGRLLNDYMALNRTVYDAARRFASTPEIELGSFDSSEEIPLSSHEPLHDRVRLLIARNGISVDRIESIRTELAPDGAGKFVARVFINVRFEPFFQYGGRISPLSFVARLGTRTTMPYLFPAAG